MTNEPLEHRLRTALREAAAQARSSAGIEQVLTGRGAARPRTRFVVPALAGAAMVAVIIAVIASVVLLRGDNGSDIRTPAAEPKETTPKGLLALEADAAVFMRADASTIQIDEVREFLRRSPDVRTFTYVDKATLYEDFKRLFRDRPDLVSSVDPSAFPTTFRIVVRDCATRPQLIQSFQAMAGVDEAIAQLGLSRAEAERFNDSPERLPPETRGRCGDQPPTSVTYQWVR